MNNQLYSEKNILDLVLVLLYVLFIIRQFSVYVKINRVLGVYSFFMGMIHLLMTFIAYNFVVNSLAADAKHYYLMSSKITDWGLSYLSNGTSFIIFLNYILVQIFQLSFLGCTMVFSFVSYLGCLQIFKIIIDATEKKYNIWYFLLLLAGLHFWTSLIGKDALIFYAMCSICHNLYFNESKKKYLLPILLIGLVRIHILIFILVGGGLSYVFTNDRIKLGTKLVFTLVVSGALFLLVPYFMQEMEVTNLVEIENKVQRSVNANEVGGAAVNLAGSSLFFKWFSYMFRPFIFEATNALFLVSAMENLVWLYMFFIIIKNLINSKNRTYIVWCYVGIILACTLPLAYTLSNFGISMRQKIMIYPFLVGLFFILNYKRKVVNENSIFNKIHSKRG